MNLTKYHDTIAEAVHRAVTDFTGSDGMGNCDLYALAGVILLRELTHENYQLQLGSFAYLVDPPGNGWMQIDARNGGLDRLEYHAWLGKPGLLQRRGRNPDEPDRYEVGEFIDFTTRHLRAMNDRLRMIDDAKRVDDGFLLTLSMLDKRIRWTRPADPDPYLWTDSEPPDEFRYIPDQECTLTYYDRLQTNIRLVADLKRLVHVHYQGLTRT